MIFGIVHLILYGISAYLEDLDCFEWDSPPALLESLRSQRKFSFNFLSGGRKVKKISSLAKVSHAIFVPMRRCIFFCFRRIVHYVCRPLSGNHRITILSVLCVSAVNELKFVVRQSTFVIRKGGKKCPTSFSKISEPL